jgi:nucleoside-diphosphate-sugar epimerase
VRGADELGIEIAKSLLEQGGYVIIIDDDSPRSQRLLEALSSYKLLTVLNYDSIELLENELRRLDYVFYFQHKSTNLNSKISSQEFLQFSNYLDIILDLSTKFEAKFLLTSSIKAHQLILGNKQIDIDFSQDNEISHSTYTELEIQRYAESLVQEYQQKVGLDSRVIRLGILLGKTFDPQEDSLLYGLIKSALKSQNILIPGDGLDNDFYIHYLDAAYGIIKAQFALNTSGKTFSLCNEENISLLSIAYKLIEIIPHANEIKFDPNDHSLPPLKLYKPAENLSEIGWRPRISFDRALAQTIDEIKSYTDSEYINDLISDENYKIHQEPNKKDIKDKFLGLFLKTEQLEETQEKGPEDALSRLISERKVQDNARLGSIILANKSLKEREQIERNKGVLKKMDNNFNNGLFYFKRRFSFLKNMSVFDFISALLLATGLGIFYFLFLAPAISLGWSVYQIKSSQDNIIQYSKTGEYKLALSNINSNIVNVKNAQERLAEVRYVYNLTQNGNSYGEHQKILENYLQMYEGFSSTFNAVVPLEEYLEEFKPNVRYRYSDKAVLSVDSTVEYEDKLSSIKSEYSTFKVGIDKVDKAFSQITPLYNNLPKLLKDYIQLDEKSIQSEISFMKSLSGIYNYLPSLIGYQQTRNILFIIQDNSRYTAGGGEIAGYVVVQFENGAIKEIKVRNADVFKDAKLSLSKEVFDEIKLMSNTVIDDTSVEFQDLSLISNQKIFFREVTSQISKKENMKIDFTSSMNLRVLEEWTSVFGNFEVNGVSFTGEDLLSKINIAMEDKKTYSSRNDVLINLFATGFEKTFNNINQNFKVLYKSLSSSMDEMNLRIYTVDPSFNKLMVNSNAIDELLLTDYMSYGMNYNQETNIVDKYSVSTLSGQILVLNDYTTKKTIELSISGADALQNSYACLPSSSKDVDLNTISPDLISRSYTNNKICYTFLKNQDLKYNIKYSTLPFATSKTDKLYKFVIFSNPGLSSHYDFEFTFAGELGEIEPIDKDYIKSGDKFIYSGTVTGHKIFTFKILTNGR